MSREHRVRHYGEAFWSQGDTTAVTSLYAPTFRLNGHVTIRREWLEEAVAWRSYFRDLSARVDFALRAATPL